MRLSLLSALGCSGTLAACAAADQFASDIAKGVNASLTPNSTVIGTVEITNPIRGYLTCFKDVPGGGASATPITNITQAQGFPAMITTRSGVVATGNCAELQAKGILVAAGPAQSATAVAFDTRKPCSTVPAELQPKFTRRCMSFDPKDPCSALPADGTWNNGQTALAGACDARRDTKVIDQVNSYKPAQQQPKGKSN